MSVNPTLAELHAVYEDKSLDPRVLARALDFIRILSRRPPTSVAVINSAKDSELVKALEARRCTPDPQ